MDQLNNFFFSGILICGSLFFFFLAFKLFSYWKQLRRAYSQLGMRWPFPGQKEMPKELENDFIKRAFLVYMSPIRASQVLFMRTTNPILRRPLKGIRRCLLAFIIFPVILIVIMIVVAVLLQTS